MPGVNVVADGLNEKIFAMGFNLVAVGGAVLCSEGVEGSMLKPSSFPPPVSVACEQSATQTQNIVMTAHTFMGSIHGMCILR